MDKSKTKVRRKVTQACENCREKRIKCSGSRPSCQNCIHLNIACVYKAVTKKRGPRSGYIEEIVSTRVLKEIERVVTENLISKENIYKLAKNNVDLFNSSEILKKYLEEMNIEENTKPENTKESLPTVNKEKNDKNTTNESGNNKSIFPILSNVKDNESVLFNKLNENKIIGESILYNNHIMLKYKMIRIDFKLIDEYFYYAHLYFPILDKDVLLERIQNKTIFPGLLLAVYGSAFMFKANPSLEMSRKYIELAYNYSFDYFTEPNIQLTQTMALISNCECGTNKGWIFLGIALRMAYLLELNKDDKSLSKKYNDERKFTFWYIMCKDMMISIITGRSCRYALYQYISSESAELFLKNLNSNVSSINLILHILLANLIQKVIQYVRKSQINSKDLNKLEEEIDYWFNIFDPFFKYHNENMINEVIGEILFKLHYNIIFSTIKILFYRHKPSIVFTTNNKQNSFRSKVFLSNILNNHNLKPFNNHDSQYLLNNDNINMNYDTFLSSSYNILRKKKLKVINHRKNSLKVNEKQEMPNKNQKIISPLINEIRPFPKAFLFNDMIYYKENRNSLMAIDYYSPHIGTVDASNIFIDKIADPNIKRKSLKFNIDNNVTKKLKMVESSSSEINKGKNIHKRNICQDLLNEDNNLKHPIKRYKSMDSSNMNIVFDIKETIKLASIDPIGLKDESVVKVYDSLSVKATTRNKFIDNDYSSTSDSLPMENIIDYNKNIPFDKSFKINYLNLENKLNTDTLPSKDNANTMENYTVTSINDNRKSLNNENNYYSKFLCDIMNPSNQKLKVDEYMMVEYINITNENDKHSEDKNEKNKSEFKNSMESLKICRDIAFDITKKVKFLKNIISPQQMKYHYVLIWCFYQIGIIFLIWYVNEGKKEDYEMVKFYEEQLEISSEYYVAVAPFLAKYREMVKEAELSVKLGIRKLAIRDIF